MKDYHIHELLDHLDGVSEMPFSSVEVEQEANDLKGLLKNLKTLSIQEIDPSVDMRMQKVLASKKSIKPTTSKRLWPYISIAASIVILLAIFTNKGSFEDSYQKLERNPERLSYIYNLHTKTLTNKDIQWLKDEVKSDINPNIKVTILDVLASHKSKLNKDFFNTLKIESIPTVQMAYLNMLQNAEHVNFKQELKTLCTKPELDNAVKQKMEYIISKQ